MATAFTAAATLTLPPDEGLANVNIPASVANSYDHESKDRYVLTGAGTKAIDFGTVPVAGAKVIFIEVEAATGANPVFIQFNGGGAPGQVEIAPGGFFMYCSPSPVTGVTSADIVYTTNVNVRVRVLA